MKKTELNKLKAIRKKCEKYSVEVSALIDTLAATQRNMKMKDENIEKALDEILMAMARLGNAKCYLIDFIRTEQPDYLETNYNL